MAKHDALAKPAVERVTRNRTDFLRSLFKEMGFEGDELETKTTVYGPILRPAVEDRDADAAGSVAAGAEG